MESNPELDRGKPYIEVRDRARPNVGFQQGENLFDRKGHFVEKSDVDIFIPEKPKPQVKVREISQRFVGTTKKSIVEKVTDLLVGDKVVASAGNDSIKRGRGRPPGSKNKKDDGIDKALQGVAKENAAARAAEAAA